MLACFYAWMYPGALAKGSSDARKDVANYSGFNREDTVRSINCHGRLTAFEAAELEHLAMA